MNKTAKDIIIELIDNNYINGEEAYTLIEAIVNTSPWTRSVWCSTTPYTGYLDTSNNWKLHTDSTTAGYKQHNYTLTTTASNTSEVN